jgi:hypothetical protein
MPPRTRRPLGLLLLSVSDKALTQGIDRSELRFTRREVREQLGWGQAQPTVYLRRLEDLA